MGSLNIKRPRIFTVDQIVRQFKIFWQIQRWYLQLWVFYINISPQTPNLFPRVGFQESFKTYLSIPKQELIICLNHFPLLLNIGCLSVLFINIVLSTILLSLLFLEGVYPYIFIFFRYCFCISFLKLEIIVVILEFLFGYS